MCGSVLRLHQVALIQVVRPQHADAHQILHELALDVDVVVHTRQEHGLVSERNPCPSKTVAGLFQFQRNFIRMINVDVQPERMEFSQHITQFLGDAHGHKDRDARANADNLDMRDFAQPGEQLFQHLGRQHERVTPGEQHIPDLWGALEGIRSASRIPGGWKVWPGSPTMRERVQ